MTGLAGSLIVAGLGRPPWSLILAWLAWPRRSLSLTGLLSRTGLPLGMTGLLSRTGLPLGMTGLLSLSGLLSLVGLLSLAGLLSRARFRVLPLVRGGSG